MDNPDINVSRTIDDKRVGHSLEIDLPPRGLSRDVAELDLIRVPVSAVKEELAELTVAMRNFAEPSEEDQKRVFKKLLARIIGK